jgi:Flp pilus assembly protein TadG
MSTIPHPPEQLPQRFQSGAAAVEFILTFPAVLLCIYLLVVYSLVFLVQQTMTFAASEGSRAAGISTTASRDLIARTRINEIMATLPTSIRDKIQPPTVETNLDASACGATQLTRNDGFSCIRVSINYPFASNPAIILLPGMEKLVPATLSASASALYEN